MACKYKHIQHLLYFSKLLHVARVYKINNIHVHVHCKGTVHMYMYMYMYSYTCTICTCMCTLYVQYSYPLKNTFTRTCTCIFSNYFITLFLLNPELKLISFKYTCVLMTLMVNCSLLLLLYVLMFALESIVSCRGLCVYF